MRRSTESLSLQRIESRLMLSMHRHVPCQHTVHAYKRCAVLCCAVLCCAELWGDVSCPTMLQDSLLAVLY